MRNIQRVMCILLIALMTVSSLSGFTKLDRYKLEKEYVKSYIAAIEGKNIEVKNPIEFYDLNGNVSMVCFSLSEIGYMIIDPNALEVVEYSVKGKNKKLEVGKKYYFNGPLDYLEIKDGQLIDTTSKKIVNSYNEISRKQPKSFSITSEVEKIEKLNNMNALVASRAEVKTGSLNHSLKKYDDNPDGVCGSVAAAIVLQYYDDHVDTKYVSSIYDYESALINKLKPYIEGTENGSTPSELRDGVDNYLDDLDITDTVYNKSYSISRVKTKINADRPVFIDLDAHTTYKEHWVVAHGYKIIDNSWPKADIVTIIVNDGHGNNDINIAPKFIGKVVYLSN